MCVLGGVPIVMCPLEVTHTALVTEKVLARISSFNSNFSKTINSLLIFFAKSYLETFSMPNPPLHDPTAVYYIINPNAFKTKLMRVEIETQSSRCSGQTICDFYNSWSKLRPNCLVCLSMDVELFWDEMITALEKANKNSPLNNNNNIQAKL